VVTGTDVRLVANSGIGRRLSSLSHALAGITDVDFNVTAGLVMC
jgi:hypothetical protein